MRRVGVAEAISKLVPVERNRESISRGNVLISCGAPVPRRASQKPWYLRTEDGDGHGTAIAGAVTSHFV